MIHIFNYKKENGKQRELLQLLTVDWITQGEASMTIANSIIIFFLLIKETECLAVREWTNLSTSLQCTSDVSNYISIYFL